MNTLTMIEGISSPSNGEYVLWVKKGGYHG